MLGLDILLKIGNLGIFVVYIGLQMSGDEDVNFFLKSPKHITSYTLGTWGLMRIAFFLLII